MCPKKEQEKSAKKSAKKSGQKSLITFKRPLKSAKKSVNQNKF